MIGKNRIQSDGEHRAFYATMSHLAAAGRRMRRPRDRRSGRRSLLQMLMPEQMQVEPANAASGPDPVRLAVLALDAVGRASLRASFSGKDIEVKAPDEATASVLRAALAETGRSRATDRLIRIVVA
ncbi:MAG TPA: hypothetical protein VHY35_08470 [Stellaceae bacterium]|nr:hypothetical protein [Stellaceae bacterium]